MAQMAGGAGRDSLEPARTDGHGQGRGHKRNASLHRPEEPQDVVAKRIKERSEQAAERLRAARALFFRNLQERLPGTVIDEEFLQRTAYLSPEAAAAVAGRGHSPAAADTVAADVAAAVTPCAFAAATPAERRAALLAELLMTQQAELSGSFRVHGTRLPLLRSDPHLQRHHRSDSPPAAHYAPGLMPYHATVATSTPSDQLRPASNSALGHARAVTSPPPLHFMTPDARFPHLSHPTLLRDPAVLVDHPASPVEHDPETRLPRTNGNPPQHGKSRRRAPARTAAGAYGWLRQRSRRRAKSADAAPQPPHTAPAPRGRSRGANKGGGFAEEATRRAARLPRTAAEAEPVEEAPLQHAWQHMQHQVLSPLHTMLASVRQPPPNPASGLAPFHRGRPPASPHKGSPTGIADRGLEGPRTETGMHLRAMSAAAAADCDAIATLAGLQEEASDSALQGRAGTAPVVTLATTAPCIGTMRARGLRQQRVSRELRRDSIADTSPWHGGPLFPGDCDSGGPAAAGASAPGRGSKAAAVSRVGSHVVGGSSGGAGAVLVRQRMRPRQSRVSGELDVSCGVLFGRGDMPLTSGAQRL
eukprot:jgi/Ulvmu1/12540/UM090_0027.1